MDFRNFYIPYVFEVEESISQFFEATSLSDLENPDQLPVSQVLKGTDDWPSLRDFDNFFIPCIFEVNESVYRSSTMLSCHVQWNYENL